MVGVCCSLETRAQTPALSVKIVDALKIKEPSWRYIGAIQTGHIPLVPSEERIIVGTWRDPESPSQYVSVEVYSVKNPEEAAKWLEPVREKHEYAGWQVSALQIGDEGYLSEYKSGAQFAIEFRKWAVVAKIAGPDLGRVKQFAQCVAGQINAND
jgi:hypothetical protein